MVLTGMFIPYLVLYPQHMNIPQKPLKMVGYNLFKKKNTYTKK